MSHILKYIEKDCRSTTGKNLRKVSVTGSVGGLCNEMKCEDGPNESEDMKEESSETNPLGEKKEIDKDMNESRQAEYTDESTETESSKDRSVEVTVRESKEESPRIVVVMKEREIVEDVCESTVDNSTEERTDTDEKND